ncbi:Plastid division protein CDP1, chloroplastic-like protein [Drosera capensis]
MSFASFLLPEITSCSHSCGGCRLHLVPSSFAAGLHCTDRSGRRWSRSRVSVAGREWEWEWEGWWRVSASALRVVEGSGGGGVSVNPTIEIPATCYQIIGVPDNAEKDQIVKSVLNLRNAEIEEGYTTEAVTSRQDLLMDVRDKLLFEPEYAGNVKENISPKSLLRIPWAWLTGALCLLQEVGEQKLVLDIGQAALKYPNSRPYANDLLLSMVLAECAVAKINFEKNHISQGFEALAQAQRLLRKEASLGKIILLFQIEASLEELTPACTLEILGLPPLPDNSERRQGAIAALRELLIQSLDVVSGNNIHDWPSFLSQALAKLTAGEIVELLPWDKLSVTRKNKKSIECQNQRVVIDFSCFYTVLVAHIALGFSSRKKDLIAKAKALCESLMASEGIDLKSEEALCLLLLGQGDEAKIEKLNHLKTSIKHASQNSVLAKQNEVSLPNPSLEIWLKDVVLGLCSDTRECSPSLDKYFGRDKKADSNLNRGAPQILPGLGQRRLYHAFSSDRRIDDDLGRVVKQPAPSNLRNAAQETRAENQSDMNMTSAQFKRELGF